MVDGWESIGLATKVDVCPTGLETVVSMEKGDDIAPMDPGASPQLKDRNQIKRRSIAKRKNPNCTTVKS